MLTPQGQAFTYYQRKANRAASFPRGTITFASNPANNATITLGGTVVTFTTGVVSGNKVAIGATTNATLLNALAFLNNSTDAGISQSANGGVFYTAVANVLSIWGNTGASVAMTVAASAATAAAPTAAAKVTRQRLPL